jgi:hypothetical protein
MKLTRMNLITIILLGFAFFGTPRETLFASSCEQVAPEYSVPDDRIDFCMERYEQCKASPLAYDQARCDEKCTFKNRDFIDSPASYLTCDKPNWEEEIHELCADRSEEILDISIEYCECIHDCRDETGWEKDCDKMLMYCCQMNGSVIESNTSDDVSQSDKSDETDNSIDTDEEDTTKNYAIIKSLKGDLETQTEDEEFKELKSKDEVYPGQMIMTGYKSEATLDIYADGVFIGTIYIPTETNFIFSTITSSDDIAEINISLMSGSISAKVEPKKGLRAKFSIKTPTSVHGVRGTIFSITYDELTNTTTAIAHEHDIYVEDLATGITYEIEEGNYTTVNGEDTPIIKNTPDELKLSDKTLEMLDAKDGFFGFSFQDDLNKDSILIGAGIIFVLYLFFLFKAKQAKKNDKKLKAFFLGIFKTLFLIGAIALGVMYFISDDDNSQNSTSSDNEEIQEENEKNTKDTDETINEDEDEKEDTTDEPDEIENYYDDDDYDEDFPDADNNLDDTTITNDTFVAIAR